MIDNNRLIAFLQELVRQPSLSGQEAAVAGRVADEMRALGYDWVETDAYGSVVGVVQGAQPGPTLLFDAHTDTVGIAPGVPWRYNPYGAEIDTSTGKPVLYGRGSADMKGALAAMVHAAGSLERGALRGRVVVSASVLEEVLEGVALRAVMARYPPDFVVIGESTEGNIARGGRGRAEIHLRTIGVPGHSSAPHLARNAVLGMVRVIDAVEAMELDSDPLMGPALLALTDIISEPYPGHSVVPSLCMVTYDRRLLPGETVGGVLAEITSLPEVAALHERSGIRLEASIGEGSYPAYTGVMVGATKFFPAWLLAEEHALVQGALRALHSVGQAPQLGAYRFCTNAAYSAGVAGVPTIGYGPGAEADAHVVDEHLLLDDLLAVAAGYRALSATLLGTATA